MILALASFGWRSQSARFDLVGTKAVMRFIVTRGSRSIMQCLAVNFLIFSFSLGILAQADIYGLSAFMLLFISGSWMLTNGLLKTLLELHLNKQIFLLIIFSFFLVQLLGCISQPTSYEYQSINQKVAALDYPSRWVLMIPVFALFCTKAINWKIPAIGLAIGILYSACVAHYQVYFDGYDRAVGSTTNSISFAQLMVVSDLLLWMYMVRANECGHRALSALFLVASLAGFYGSLLAVSRGAWLAYVAMSCVWLCYVIGKDFEDWASLFSTAMLIRIGSACLIFLVVSSTHQYQTMQSSMERTIQGVAANDFDAATSHRISIFEISVQSIERHPFGVGTNNFKVLMPADSVHADAHNEILNVGVENGILGALILLLLFLFLLWIFIKNLKSQDDNNRLNASLGLILISSYSVFSLSSTVFSNHDTLIFFIFYLYLFFGQLVHREKIKE